MNITRTPKILLVAAAMALALTGCAASTPTAEAPPTPAPAADSLAIADAWVKSAEEGMSAAFGVLENIGDEDITIVSGTSTASSTVELHETVESGTGEMVMRPKEGGFVIPAGGSFEIAPGGNHIMLMGLVAPIVAGEEASVVLTLSDGSTFSFTAPVKDYEGANETYVGDGMNMDMGGE